MRLKQAALALLLVSAALTLPAHAQDKTPDKPTDDKSVPRPEANAAEQAAEAQLHTTDCSKMPARYLMMDCAAMHSQVKTIFLKNVTAQNDANEILVAVRNAFDPGIKVFLDSSINAIVIGTYPEEFARIETLVRTLDLPHRAYKLTYTFVDSEDGKRTGVQHISIVDVAGQRTTLKQGSKIPVSTGSYKDSGGSQQQFTYLDVGMNIDATLAQVGEGLQLKTKVEASGIAGTNTIADVTEPVIRQSVFEGVANLIPGKPVALGQIDLPGTTHHVDIEVVAELIP